MIEPLLLTATQISTFDRARMLTKASGFFFSREDRLFLVTSRHVVCDEPSKHFPGQRDDSRNGVILWRHWSDRRGPETDDEAPA
jgi:hypothetical protein